VDLLVCKIVILICLGISLLQAEVDSGLRAKRVRVKGENLSAKEVLLQVEKQLGIQIDLDLEDKFGFVKNYDDEVSVGQIVDAVISYYREFNHLDLEAVQRAGRKISLRRVKEALPEVKSEFELAADRVVHELRPEKPNPIVEFEKPSDDGVKRTHKKGGVILGKQKTLNDSMDLLPIVKDVEVVSEKNIDKNIERQEGEIPKLEIEVIGRKLVDFEESILKDPHRFEEDPNGLKKRMETLQPELTFGERFHGYESDEWTTSPSVEMGYFGASTPWLKPSCLKYKIEDHRLGELRLGYGHSDHKDVNDKLDAIDMRTEKLNFSYLLGLSDELYSELKTGLIRNKGEIAVAASVYEIDATGLSDTNLSLNYVSGKGLGEWSVGLELSLPTGNEADFTGTGGLNFATLLGYHFVLSRWRAEIQASYLFLGDYEGYGLFSESSAFAVDFGTAYYCSETIDLGFHLHWAESPWKNLAGVWGQDIFIGQVVLESKAWTDPVFIYVDIGLSDAVPDLGAGIQWLRTFR